MDRPIITRAEAKAAGLARYFTGKPCKHGHLSERKVGNGCCAECEKAIDVARRVNNAEKLKAARIARHAQNPERRKAIQAASYARHAEKRRAEKAAYSIQNAEKLRAARIARYAQNPEKAKAAMAKYRARNAEKVKAIQAAYRAQNPEKTKARHKAWAANNPEKVLTNNRNRRAMKKAAEGHHTPEDIQRIHIAQRGKCACCKEKVGKKYHVDHIQPLAKGGSNWPSNLQILCPFCNISKKDRDPIEFSQSLGMLL